MTQEIIPDRQTVQSRTSGTGTCFNPDVSN